MTDRRPPRDGEAGVTLLEMACVLAIIGVAAGATVIAAGGRDRSIAVRAEALRLADRLSFAADQALITRETIALEIDEEGYVFLVLAERSGARGAEDWAPHDSDLLGLRHQAPAGVGFAASFEDDRLPVDPGRGVRAEILVEGEGAAWRVAFDGLGARAAPVEPE